jgi:NADPH:quinone reductase-like Zn-dependent oxidoreductase
VLVRVEAAGVNFSDVKRRRGDTCPVGGYFAERPAVAAAALGELLADVMAERIRVPAIQTLPLDEAARAHVLLEAR